MGFPEWTAVGVAVLAILSGIIGTLLARKDAAQEKTIDRLEAKIVSLENGHTADKEELNNLRIELAKLYAPKHEIKEMIEDVKKHVDDKFEQLMRLAFDRRSGS